MATNPPPAPASAPGVNSNESVTVSRQDFDWIINKLAVLGEQLPPSTAPSPAPGLSPAGSAAPPGFPETAPATASAPAPVQTRYATQYRIHVRGTFAKDGEHALLVCTGTEIVRTKLKLVEFLTLLVLGSFARGEAGLTTPITVRGGEYLEPSRILKEILKLKRNEPDLENQAEKLVLQDVYQARYGIRGRLQEAGLNQDLFESLRDSGYRLSTLPAWIKITLFDDEGSNTWD